MQAIATIKHNDRDDVRVTLYDGGDGFVWAAAPDEEPHKTDVEIDRAEAAWAGDAWDYTPLHSYYFRTDADSGTMEAASPQAALESLAITQAMIDDGAWAWVEGEDGERHYIAKENCP